MMQNQQRHVDRSNSGVETSLTINKRMSRQARHDGISEEHIK